MCVSVHVQGSVSSSLSSTARHQSFDLILQTQSRLTLWANSAAPTLTDYGHQLMKSMEDSGKTNISHGQGGPFRLHMTPMLTAY